MTTISLKSTSPFTSIDCGSSSPGLSGVISATNIYSLTSLAIGNNGFVIMKDTNLPNCDVNVYDGITTLSGTNNLRSFTNSTSSNIRLYGTNNFTDGIYLKGKGALTITNSNAINTGSINLIGTTFGGPTETFILSSNGPDINIYNPIIINTDTGRENIVTRGVGNFFFNQILLSGSGSLGYVVSPNALANLSYTLTISSLSANGNSIISLRGAQAGNAGIVNGPIITPGGLNFNGSFNGTSWLLSATGSKYTPLIMNSYSKVSIGVDNGVATNALINWSGKDFIPAATFDLNGFNQICAGLTCVSTGASATLINTGPRDSVLTLSALATTCTYGNENAVWIRISDGPTNKLSLVLDSFARVQTLSSDNTYTGSTSIVNGTLTLRRIVSSSNGGNPTTGVISTAAFTPTALTVTFTTAPVVGDTFRLLTGPTVQSYTPSLTNASGRTGSYNSATSTLTIS